MKYGYRKPNINSRIKARTTGKIKRSVKRATNPLYGKKGMGLATNPKKSIYNRVYSRTTVDAFRITLPLPHFLLLIFLLLDNLVGLPILKRREKQGA